jgi:hypothetical protein
MKEEKFEKVVEWDEDTFIVIFGLFSIIIHILFVISIYEGWEIAYLLAIFCFFSSLIWITGLIITIRERKVYWRKIK